MYRGYRYSTVPIYRSHSIGNLAPSVATATLSTSSRLPTYCPPHGQYYGYTKYSRPVTTKSPSKTSHMTKTSSHTFEISPSIGTSAIFDPVYPVRMFGSRLGKGYSSAAMARPEIYDHAYGVSFLPGYGRDSFSAYKMVDATIDDGDDLVSVSSKRDNQVLRNVERTIAGVTNLPPVRRPFIRASSVPPRLHGGSYTTKKKAIQRPGAVVTVKAGSRKAGSDIYYSVPPPKVNYHYETVRKGGDLLTAQERMYARECVDLTSPSGTMSLKMRLNDVQNALAKHGAMLSKYSTGPDADDIEVTSELRRIKTNRAMRAKSVV